MREAKVLGFSDFQIARFVLNPTGNMEKETWQCVLIVNLVVSSRL